MFSHAPFPMKARSRLKTNERTDGASGAILYGMSYSLIEKQVLYDGRKIRLEVHQLENDQTMARVKWEIVVHPGAVVILPFLDAETILLIRNHRYAIGKVIYELPAGTIEKGEPPMNCAGRELEEETGYLPTRLKPLASFYASPGVLTEKMHVFLAYDLEKTAVNPDEGEQIEVFPVAFDEAIAMIADGRIEDSKTIASLLMYDRFHRNKP